MGVHHAAHLVVVVLVERAQVKLQPVLQVVIVTQLERDRLLPGKLTVWQPLHARQLVVHHRRVHGLRGTHLHEMAVVEVDLAVFRQWMGNADAWAQVGQRFGVDLGIRSVADSFENRSIARVRQSLVDIPDLAVGVVVIEAQTDVRHHALEFDLILQVQRKCNRLHVEVADEFLSGVLVVPVHPIFVQNVVVKLEARLDLVGIADLVVHAGIRLVAPVVRPIPGQRASVHPVAAGQVVGALFLRNPAGLRVVVQTPVEVTPIFCPGRVGTPHIPLHVKMAEVELVEQSRRHGVRGFDSQQARVAVDQRLVVRVVQLVPTSAVRNAVFLAPLAGRTALGDRADLGVQTVKNHAEVWRKLIQKFQRTDSFVVALPGVGDEKWVELVLTTGEESHLPRRKRNWTGKGEVHIVTRQVPVLARTVAPLPEFVGFLWGQVVVRVPVVHQVFRKLVPADPGLDDSLAPFFEDQRVALERLRAVEQAVLPATPTVEDTAAVVRPVWRVKLVVDVEVKLRARVFCHDVDQTGPRLAVLRAETVAHDFDFLHDARIHADDRPVELLVDHFHSIEQETDLVGVAFANLDLPFDDVSCDARLQTKHVLYPVREGGFLVVLGSHVAFGTGNVHLDEVAPRFHHNLFPLNRLRGKAEVHRRGSVDENLHTLDRGGGVADHPRGDVVNAGRDVQNNELAVFVGGSTERVWQFHDLPVDDLFFDNDIHTHQRVVRLSVADKATHLSRYTGKKGRRKAQSHEHQREKYHPTESSLHNEAPDGCYINSSVSV